MLLLLIFWFSFILWVYFWAEPMKLLILLEVFSVSFILLVSSMLIMFELSFLYFCLSLVFLVCESVVGFLLFVVYITFNFDLVKKSSFMLL